eukprot:jgi/Ulvmu1/3802/UM018_0012.1
MRQVVPAAIDIRLPPSGAYICNVSHIRLCTAVAHDHMYRRRRARAAKLFECYDRAIWTKQCWAICDVVNMWEFLVDGMLTLNQLAWPGPALADAGAPESSRCSALLKGQWMHRQDLRKPPLGEPLL